MCIRDSDITGDGALRFFTWTRKVTTKWSTTPNAPPDAASKLHRRWKDARRVHATRSPQRQAASLRVPANADDDPASSSAFVSPSRLADVARLFSTLSPFATLASVRKGLARGSSPSRNARLPDASSLAHALAAVSAAACHDLNTASAPQNGSASTRLERGDGGATEPARRRAGGGERGARRGVHAARRRRARERLDADRRFAMCARALFKSCRDWGRDGRLERLRVVVRRVFDGRVFERRRLSLIHI